LIYNVYIASILGFVAQFYPPTKEVLEAESLSLRRFNRGPGNWCTTQELFNLDTWFGFRYRFTSVTTLALAAKARVIHCEMDAAYGRVKTLGDAMLDSDHRRLVWYDWLYHSPFHNLDHANTHLTTLGLDTPTIARRIILELDPKKKDPDSTVRKNLQRFIYKGQLKSEVHLKTHAVRRRIIRWTALINHRRSLGPILPPRAAENFLHNLEVIHSKAKPRVAAAVWKTLWNGWCTSRRFQTEGRCIFGCASNLASDSLEHYLFCPILVHFTTGWMNIKTRSCSARATSSCWTNSRATTIF
jgi:hypothetical protein